LYHAAFRAAKRFAVERAPRVAAGSSRRLLLSEVLTALLPPAFRARSAPE